MSPRSPAGAGRLELFARLSRVILDQAAAHQEAFLSAQPFRHIRIDSFEEDFAERLLAEFPAFDRAPAKNELYGEGWRGKATNPEIRFRIRPLKGIRALRVRGWRPDYAPAASLTVRLEGDLVADTTVGHGVFEVSIGGEQFPITRAARLEIECQPAFRTEGDDRELAFLLMEIRAEHR